jgi:hypothetical protein
MRRCVTLLLLVCLVSTLALTPTTTEAVAINLRNNGKSSAVGVLSTSAELVAEPVTNDKDKKDSAPPPPAQPTAEKNIGTREKVLGKYHELPEEARYFLAAIGILFGLALGLFGYQLLRTTIFALCGFMSGAMIYVILERSLAEGVHNRAAIVYIASGVVGVVFGLICLYYTALALVFIGASLGVVLAVVLDPVALRFMYVQPGFFVFCFT